MAATATELNTRLDALKKALHTGSLTVRHGDTSVTYRSLAEIRGIIADIEKELADLSNTPRTVKYIRQTGRG